MRTVKWSLAGILGLLALGLVTSAWAQAPPNQWHPYKGASNCVQVADANGNFNCWPGITINPTTGAVSGLAGGGTVTNTGVLTSNAVIIGNGSADLKPLASLGSSGQCLMSNGAGTPPSFQACGGGGGGTPGGSTTQLQYNNAGSFGGVTGATSNGTSVTLTSPTLVTPALGTPTSGVLTSATGLPLTTGVTGTLPVGNGGTGATTLTSHGVVVGSGASAVTATSAGTAGQCLTSNGASADPTFQSCGAGGGVTTTGSPASGQIPIMSGANSITGSSAITSPSAGALTATGAITGQSLVANGSATGSLTLTNVGGAGFSFIMSPGNPAANITMQSPITTPTGTQCLTGVGTAPIVTAWGACSGGSGTVTTTGSPANGNLAKFTGATSVSNADLTGDVTTAGGVATTLAASGVTAGSCGDTTHSCSITVDAKGRVTAQSNNVISGGGGAFTDTTTIYGLVITKNAGGNTLDITAGVAYDPSSTTMVSYAGATAVSAGTLGASQWNQVYLFSSSGTPTIEVVNNADPPSTTYAGTARQGGTGGTRRWIGSFLTTSGSAIYAQSMIEMGKGSARVLWLTAQNAAPFRALAAGSATSYTAVSLAGAVARYAVAEATINHLLDSSLTTTVSRVQTSVDGTNDEGQLSIAQFLSGTFPSTSQRHSVDPATPRIFYKVDAGTTTTYIDVLGYTIGR